MGFLSWVIKTETGSVCFDLIRGAGLHCSVCTLRPENDFKRQSVMRTVSVASPLNNNNLEFSTVWADKAIFGSTEKKLGRL